MCSWSHNVCETVLKDLGQGLFVPHWSRMKHLYNICMNHHATFAFTDIHGAQEANASYFREYPDFSSGATTRFTFVTLITFGWIAMDSAANTHVSLGTNFNIFGDSQTFTSISICSVPWLIIE